MLLNFLKKFSKCRLNFEHFEKKEEQNCGLREARLDKCLQSFISEDPTRKDMVNSPKHC